MLYFRARAYFSNLYAAAYADSLFFIDIASRSVHVAGFTPHPDNRWMTQIARNVTDTEDGFLRGTRYLILDRDTKYSDEFRNALIREGIHLVRLPPQSPNLNAYASYCT